MQLALASLIVLAVPLAIPLAANAAGPAIVNLSSADSFVILSKTGITNVPTSAISGNVGSSPITGAAIGVTCAQVTGIIYTVDAAGPLPCRIQNSTILSAAVSDMQTAYTDAAGRTTPTATELGAGNIGGLTIAPGLYKWSSNVLIPTNVTLSGSANDVWIFQIAGDLNLSSSVQVVLAGGAQAANVFWQVGGPTGATLGTNSTFKGNILASKQIILKTGASLNGRALAQTQVTLEGNNISIAVRSAAPVVVVTPPVVTPAPVIPAPTVSSNANVNAATTNNPTNPVNPTNPAVTYSSTNYPSGSVSSYTTSDGTIVYNGGSAMPNLDPNRSNVSNAPVYTPVYAPTFPNTGLAPEGRTTVWDIAVLIGAFMIVSLSLFVGVVRKNQI